jgi:hypothetical protein
MPSTALRSTITIIVEVVGSTGSVSSHPSGPVPGKPVLGGPRAFAIGAALHNISKTPPSLIM